jgi:hypothetical protein
MICEESFTPITLFDKYFIVSFAFSCPQSHFCSHFTFGCIHMRDAAGGSGGRQQWNIYWEIRFSTFHFLEHLERQAEIRTQKKKTCLF